MEVLAFQGQREEMEIDDCKAPKHPQYSFNNCAPIYVKALCVLVIHGIDCLERQGVWGYAIGT